MNPDGDMKSKNTDVELMRDRIAFARSVSNHSLRLLGFIDSKASIIVGINGVLLALLFESVNSNLVPIYVYFGDVIVFNQSYTSLKHFIIIRSWKFVSI